MERPGYDADDPTNKINLSRDADPDRGSPMIEQRVQAQKGKVVQDKAGFNRVQAEGIRQLMEPSFTPIWRGPTSITSDSMT